MKEEILYGKRIEQLEDELAETKAKLAQSQKTLAGVPFIAIKKRMQFKTPRAWMTFDDEEQYNRANDAIERWIMLSGNYFTGLSVGSVENSEEQA